MISLLHRNGMRVTSGRWRRTDEANRAVYSVSKIADADSQARRSANFKPTADFPRRPLSPRGPAS
jgi:predicted carbohydrate-binding protein with CBM5 and CBM33 domain